MKKLGLLLLAVMMISLSSCGDAKEKAKDAAEATTEAVGDAAEATKDAAKDAAEATTEAVKDAAGEAVDAVKDAVKDVDGKAVFASNGCAACHNMDKKTVGPAVKEIAKAYAGKKDEMVKFLKGEGKAIVDAPQFAVMQPQIATTKKLSDAELGVLVDYFLSAK